MKIFIPRLSEFKDDDIIKTAVKLQPTLIKTGLLGMLPKPSQKFAPASKPSSNFENRKHTAPSADTSVPTEQKSKKIGMIPYSLMPHKPKVSDSLQPLKKKPDSDDDEVKGTSFFTFESNDDEVLKVNDDEVRALVEKERVRLEERRKQIDKPESSSYTHECERTDFNQECQPNIDEEALKMLTGGNKAKRSKLDNIEIIELSAAEVMPNREEWMRKTLAGETAYMPTGNIIDKVRICIHQYF